MRIHKRTTRVAGVDRCVGLNKVTRLASVIGEIRPADRAHDATSDGEAEIAKGISNRQYGLSRDQLGGVTPRDGWQVFGVDLDHGQICKFVGANYFGRERPAVMQRYAHFHRAVDHVIVGDDVSIGGDDQTTAKAMLNLPLALSHVRHTMAEL